MVSSAVASGVGLVYWVVAARLFDADVVGVNSALVSTLTFLGSAAQLNLGSALLRFVPVAGRGAVRLVGGSYGVAAVTAALAGAAFAAGAPWWAPQLLALTGHAGLVLLFALATPVFALFIVQDYVLTAVRRAVLVPVENLLFSVLKIGLLVLGAALGSAAAIVGSWAVATAVAVGAVSVCLVRVVPAARGVPAGTVTAREVGRFAAADWVGTLFLNVVNFGLPLLVLARLGADAAATFGIAWAVAFGLYLVATGMGQSLVAHVAADPARVGPAVRGMVTKALTLVVPAAVLLVPGAPWVLAVFGPHYAATGAVLLALLAVSAVPNVVPLAALALARVRRHRLGQVGVPALLALLVVPAAWVLMPVLGLAGVGVAVLGGQVVLALGLLVAWARRGAPA